jgi:membrane protein implicated in regulation of membrane protease activity
MLNFKNTTAPSYQEGIVDEVVQQGRKWRVRFRSSIWSARSTHPLKLFPGDTVKVTKIGLPLVIDRADPF